MGGTWKIDSIKWLAGTMIGTKRQVFGSISRNARWNWRRQATTSSRAGIWLLWVIQHWARGVLDCRHRQDGAHSIWPLSARSRPPSAALLLAPVYVQSIGVIQAPDIMQDGTADMATSNTDMTYWNGELVNSCRMDEYRLFGGFVTVVNRA
ncbi:MAG: hypothetical protein U0559_01570 [Anaerolineae bacterium]